jgi:hypothetical protein
MDAHDGSDRQKHYQRIVDIIVNHVESAGKIFSYCMADDGFVSIAVYSDEGDHILRHEMLDELADPVLDAWYAEPKGKRWEYFELVVNDADFTFDFTYPGEFDPKEGWSDREIRLLENQFGKKPVDYGSPDGWVYPD